MAAVTVAKVSFRVTDEAVAVRECVPLIESLRDLTSTELYDPSGQCKKCYPVTNYCRGHEGKILFRYCHIYYPYRKYAAKLLSMTCTRCLLPLRASRCPKQPEEKVKYLKLVELCDYAECQCTGEKDTCKGYGLVYKLQSLCRAFRSQGRHKAIMDLFLLPEEERQMLRSYVLVLPPPILSSLPDGLRVTSIYRKILKYHGSVSSVEDCLPWIYKLYKQYSAMLKDKLGTARQLLLPRRVGNSIRAVIISDTSIGIADVKVSHILGDKVCRTVTVCKDNYSDCARMLSEGRVSRVCYGKQRYKLSSTRLLLVVINSKSRTEIEEGSTLRLTLAEVTSEETYIGANAGHIKSKLMSMCKVELGHRCIVEQGSDRNVLVYVEVVQRGGIRTERIPLQHYMQMEVPASGQKVLVHRNPVLSAGSMHTHALTLSGDPQGVRHQDRVSLTVEEKQQQREQMDSNRSKLVLVQRGTTYKGREDVRRAQWAIDLAPEHPVYRLRTSVQREISTSLDVDCCMSFNPVVMSTYQGDYDGDEMNLAYVGEDPGAGRDISVTSDLLKGLIGPLHDGRHGLYCIVSGAVGLSHLQQCYKETMSSSMSDEKLYTTAELVDLGLSTAQAADLATKLERLNTETERHSRSHSIRASKAEVLEYLSTCTSYTWLHGSTKLAEDIVSSLRLREDRLTLMSNAKFNRFMVECMPGSSVEYRGLTERDLVSAVYADVIRVLYAVCDYCGISYKRLDKTASAHVLDSMCRPSSSTIESIYGSVGYATFAVEGMRVVSHIDSGYAVGVSQIEFDRLCYSARAQVVRKAETTAPEGDNMRLQCNYLSDVSGTSETSWAQRSETFLEHADPVRLRDIRAKASAYFTRVYSDVLLHDAPRMEYQAHESLSEEVRSRRKNLVHIGQRKLLMSEVEFLTKHAADGDVVVYAGAAPGTHIAVLLEMFPKVRFHLYDKNKYSANLYDNVSKNPRRAVEMLDIYLTASIAAQEYGPLSNVLFVSDIRTNSGESSDMRPSDDDVARDNSANVAMVQSMCPKACLIKFRLPYSQGSSSHFEGKLMLQCWPGHASTEVRLMCHGPYVQREYDHTEHEEKMFHHNMLRPFAIVGKKVNGNIARRMAKWGIRPHYDMYRETAIVSEYMSKYGGNEANIYRLIDSALGSNLKYYLDKREL